MVDPGCMLLLKIIRNFKYFWVKFH
jgi:hypothetical protein